MIRNVPLRGLSAFCVVARNSSIKHAAAELCVTASAVSHQIKDLEARLGIRLFERGTRSLSITPAGRGLFEDIEPLIRGIDRATARWGKPVEQPVLNVNLPAYFASELFIPRLKEFSESQPQIDIRIETTESDRGVMPPGADLSIVLSDRPPVGHLAEPLFNVRFVPASSPELYRRLDVPAMLETANLIVHRDRPLAWLDWARVAAVARPRPKRLIRLNTMSGVVSAAEQGLGVALLPMPLSRGRFMSGALVPVTQPTLDSGDAYYLVHRQENDRPEVRALRAWLVDDLAPSLQAGTNEM